MIKVTTLKNLKQQLWVRAAESEQFNKEERCDAWDTVKLAPRLKNLLCFILFTLKVQSK